MKVVEIRQEAELHKISPAWDGLLQQSAANTIFLTCEWVTAWWATYGHPGDLLILAAFDETNLLRGIAPLRYQAVRRYGQTVSALSFIGDGSNDSEYLDFIFAPGYEKEVMESFRAHLADHLNRGTALILNEVPETSPSVPLLRTLGEQHIWTETEIPCGTVRLPQTWEHYLSMLRPRFRTKIRSVLRNLECRPEVQFGFCETPEQIHRLLPLLFDLHARRWAQDDKPGVFGWDRKRHFYHVLSPILLDRGWLRFSWLEWQGRVLACQYGFAYKGTYFHLQEGYEPSSEHWNVGVGLRAWSIRELLKEGVGEYDFLGGVGRHKTDWGAQVKQSKQIVLAGKSYKNFLFCRGPEWEAGARESVKKLIPDKVLVARRACMEARRTGKEKWSASEWLQKAAANSYFHFRLPLLTRAMREHYQLSVSTHGRWPKMSWERRREPAARILIYHRVNDGKDAFFPAISTDLFEQEMRFVARHYKVVSLSEALNRLEDGSPGNVLTVTFDDGYQDNYENAFPILQRYGLPATIFLTTGSIDSREPLWFEQLAQACKKTAREFVDLEIDIPRRCWMRTQAERLQSNNLIFRTLRDLPDAQRQFWLTEILRQLAAQDNERKDKMLTWDQVRLMKAHEIEFGGHTVTHPFLSKTTREQAVWEVLECKRRIEQEVQSPVSYFAYPNGRDEDFGKSGREVVRSAGYRAALTTIWGMNYRSTDRMELKRGGPWEQSPALFAYKLDWYQLVND